MSSQLIYATIERLGGLLRNEMRREGSEHGLQPIQLEALHYLSICNRYSDTPMAVTEYLGQTKGTVSQSLKVLQKKGFLTKQADKNDKRVIHLKVSIEGKALITKSIPIPLFTQACEQLSVEFKTRIMGDLKELLYVIQRTNSMKLFGVCRMCRYNQKDNSGNYFCGLTKEALSQGDVQLICREYKNVA